MDAEKMAQILMDLGAVLVRPERPFVFASGIKSPIYCDNRLLISHPVERRAVVDGFLYLLHDHTIQFDTVSGTATAGIPWAAWIAHATDKPMIYVRRDAKGHGRQNNIEGQLQAGARVVVIEDLVSSGVSSVNTIESIQKNGGFVTACLAIFSYQMRTALQRFADIKVPLYVLCGFSDLIEYACTHRHMSQDHKGMVLEWAKDPQGWGAKYDISLS
ncbi:MAG: orotate phosphoribosyltransferase [Deltaproteobacteria bacterium]|nr:orotate phosphoribosyltransferase [Deltaproteobacteria bacterium]